jgi:hypothetical protein
LVLEAAVVSPSSMALSGTAQATKSEGEKEKEKKKRSTKWRRGVVFIFLFVGCVVCCDDGRRGCVRDASIGDQGRV